MKPETVVRWRRAGFRAYWLWKSRRRGRPSTDLEIGELIRQIASENATWGAPRVHAELQKLGFKFSERTVSRYMPKRPAEPDAVERWKIFLQNHREAIAAMDFFTVPTITFNVLYILFVVHHARRQILHFNVTAHPASEWVVQQLREAFPYESAPRYLIFDRDGKFAPSVVAAIEAMGIKPSRTAFRSPWQNGVAERWIGSVRRELLDLVVVLNERHFADYFGITCRIITKIVATLGSRKTPRRPDRLVRGRAARRRSLPCLASVVCTTATSGAKLPDCFRTTRQGLTPTS